MHNTEERDRVRREVVILNEEPTPNHTNNEDREGREGRERDEEQEGQEGQEGQERDEEQEMGEKRSMPWLIFTTGRILTEGSLPYHRYFIAIAIMCFLSIFLTFMSLNANREYKQREEYASILHERAILREEKRYGLSSKSAVTSRLQKHGIELIELSKDSRIIEK